MPGALTSSEFKHFCAACTSCVADPSEPCLECGSEPPAEGWPDIATSRYRYLGRIVEGRYLLDRFLGDGATGYVYRASALQIRRMFACKIVDTRRYKKKEFEEELLRRFRLEVEAMSRLRNPHVVAIYEAMQLNDGVFALLMDFVDGRTLQELLDRVGRIKLIRALEIIRQVANGVYEAHRAGFIHRDLKPDNIMIEQLPASGFFARILDFGIVHVMGGSDATQGFRGTPLYASPEQCMGSPGLDNRSDIYSLGCVFFHCIAGQPPFPGTESLRVMDAHVNEEPPRLSDVLPGSRIPEQLETLMARMLAKEPEDRPRDLSEVIHAIDDVIRELEPPRQRLRTNPGKPPGAPVGRKQMPNRGRVATGDFPSFTERAPRMGSGTAGKSQVVSPLVEYHLPKHVASEVVAFTACGLNATGDAAIVADQLNRVHVVGLKNEGLYHMLEGARGLIVSVYFDSDRGEIFGCEMDGTIQRWTVDQPQKPTRLGQIEERVYVLNASNDGKRLLCGTERGRVVSVDVATGAKTTLVKGGQPISALGLSNSAKKLIVGYWGGKLSSVDLVSGAETALEAVPTNAKSIVVSKDGYVAAVLDEAGNVRILGMHDGRAFFTMQAEMASLRALAFAADGQLMGLGVIRTTMQLWEIQNRAIAPDST